MQPQKSQSMFDTRPQQNRLLGKLDQYQVGVPLRHEVESVKPSEYYSAIFPPAVSTRNEYKGLSTSVGAS